MSASAKPSAADPHRDPQPGGIRARLEKASTPLVTALARVPAFVPFLVMLALMLAGIFVGGVPGTLLLAVPLLFLGWLLFLTWPHLGLSERVMRCAVLLLVVGIAVTQIIPR